LSIFQHKCEYFLCKCNCESLIRAGPNSAKLATNSHECLYNYQNIWQLSSYSMKSTIFWDVMSLSVVEVHWCFTRTYCFHLQCQSVSQAISQQNVGSKYIPEDCNLHTHFCVNLESYRFRLSAVLQKELSILHSKT
jgi:hypothetical protein